MSQFHFPDQHLLTIAESVFGDRSIASAVREQGRLVQGTWVIGKEDFDSILSKARLIKPRAAPAPQPPAPTHGPGTELKALLKDWLGIEATSNCSCNARARQMDEWGPDECERRIPEIVGWLEEQARARKLPFVRFAAEQAIKLAIRRARKAAARQASRGHKSSERAADDSPDTRH